MLHCKIRAKLFKCGLLLPVATFAFDCGSGFAQDPHVFPSFEGDGTPLVCPRPPKSFMP